MHVQEACISVRNAAYQDRIDQAVAHIPLKSANGTSAAILSVEAYAPLERILLPAAAPEESAYQTTPALEVPPEALVAQEDSGSKLPSSDEVFTVVWSVLTVVLLHALVLL
jgi:hypothetical protein